MQLQANNYTASCLDRSPTTSTSLSASPTASTHHLLRSLPFGSLVALSLRPTDGGRRRRRRPRRATLTDDMSHRRLGRVVSDLSHSNSRSVTDHSSLHQQSATSNHEGGNAGKGKQKLSLFISSVVSFSWTRSESSGETEKNSSSTKQQTNGGGTGRRRRGLEIVLAVRKYVAMVEQLFSSSSDSASSSQDEVDRRRQGRPHTFTSARRHAGGSAIAAAQSSKRHRWRLSSAPASLQGSPATSGHLSVGESVVTKASTSSEVSTMEELQSAIQAAIAHCKNSVAGGGC